ncbi:hypothetical protein BKA80DRAFT_100564 [Phyllosticta citrichinensis]
MAHGTPSNAQQCSRNQASPSVASYRLPGCRSKNSPAAGGWYVGRTSLVITWEGTGQGSVRASSENETESKENKSFGPRTLRLRHGAYRMGRHDASQGPCGSGDWKMMIMLMVGCGGDVGIVIESLSGMRGQAGEMLPGRASHCERMARSRCSHSHLCRVHSSVLVRVGSEKE